MLTSTHNPTHPFVELKPDRHSNPLDLPTLPAWEIRFQFHLKRLMSGVHLSRKESLRFESDIREAVRYYTGASLSIEDAFERIGPDPFGGFYSDPPDNEWYPLDSAAKVYPLSMTRSKMAMFRVSANMSVAVVPSILQLALHITIKRFPTFATILKCGLFWHYLDARRKRFIIEPETRLPCAPLKVNSANDQVFRIIYFRNRISLEVFHCVSDGYGAMVFLKTLLAEYLRLLGEPAVADTDILDTSGRPLPEESVDAYKLTDDTDRTAGYGRGKSIQFNKKRSDRQPAQIIHLVMSTTQLAMAAKERKTSVTGLILSIMFMAAKAASSVKNKNEVFKIQVPVNMRQYYPIMTLRNFTLYAIIKIPYRAVTNLSDTIPLVTAQLKAETAKVSLDRMAAMTNNLVNNRAIKYQPIGLKRVLISRVVNVITGKSFTAILSNLGIVKTDFSGNIERFDAIAGPSRTNQAGCALISYRDNAVLSITKHTLDTTFESELYDILTSLNMEIIMEGNCP